MEYIEKANNLPTGVVLSEELIDTLQAYSTDVAEASD